MPSLDASALSEMSFSQQTARSAYNRAIESERKLEAAMSDEEAR